MKMDDQPNPSVPFLKPNQPEGQPPRTFTPWPVEREPRSMSMDEAIEALGEGARPATPWYRRMVKR